MSDLAPRERLALALPLGLGAFLVAVSVGALVSSIFAFALEHALRDPSSPREPVNTPGALVVIALVCFGMAGAGFALRKLVAPARYVAVGIGALGLLLAANASAHGSSAGFALAIPSLLAIALLLPAVGVFFAPPPRREEALAVPSGAFLGAVAWGTLLLVGLVTVPAFKKMFMETGIILPTLTEVVISVATRFEGFGVTLILPAAIILGPAALLGVDTRRARIAVHAIGGGAFTLFVCALVGPLFELARRL